MAEDRSHLAQLGKQRKQVGHADVGARLGQQRRHLPAVVGLVIEEMGQQAVEFTAVGLAFGVGVVQSVIVSSARGHPRAEPLPRGVG